jgi:hypothetical protein
MVERETQVRKTDEAHDLELVELLAETDEDK